jgi:hypothetical protein
MPAQRPSPCRLFVYLARDAPLGVVLRRGPSDWVRLSRWRTDDDTFEHGQWMKARVFERRSDLSPDGALFVAFVRGAGGPDWEHRDSWVAVSRPPWFTALALWFVGGTYCMGGYFPDQDSLWLGFTANPPDQGRLPPWLTPTTAPPPYLDRTDDWTDRTVWLNRLLRDGWHRLDGASPETWQRPNPDATLTLLMTLRSNTDFHAYGGRHVIEYAVRTEPDGPTTPLGRATWADWDHRGRLILAQHGRLLHWRPPNTLHELADFNPQSPDPAPSPPSAHRWPSARARGRGRG